MKSYAVHKKTISEEKIARAIRKLNFQINNRCFDIVTHQPGGEGLSFYLKNGQHNYWLKLYNGKVDSLRGKRLKKLEEVGVIPYRTQYIPNIRIYFPNLPQDMLEKIRDASLLENLPYPSWRELIEKGGLANKHEFAKSLVETVKNWEDKGISHRDLSCRNLLIDTNRQKVFAIDWDQAFLPNLGIPASPKKGTPGYMPPRSIPIGYQPISDRYALMILICEFLGVNRPTEEIPVFTTNELLECQNYHQAQKILKNKFQGGIEERFLSLAVKTLSASSFSEMTSPQEWLTCFSSQTTKTCSSGFIVIRRKQNKISFPVKTLTKRSIPRPRISIKSRRKWPKIVSWCKSFILN